MRGPLKTVRGKDGLTRARLDCGLIALAFGIALAMPVSAVATPGQADKPVGRPSNTLRFGGRLMLDRIFETRDGNHERGELGVRRARLSLRFKSDSGFRARASVELSSGNPRLRDGWIGYRRGETRVRVGQMLQPVGLEELTSSNATTFMERALPNVLLPGYSLGVEMRRSGDSWSLTGGAYGGSVRSPRSARGVAGRLTFAPLARRRHAIHLGASVRYSVQGEGPLRFRARPEAQLSERLLVNTRAIEGAESVLGAGLELAVVLGPLSLQGEYNQARVTRRDGLASATFSGWYAATSWFLTPDSRRYRPSSGTFVAARPRRGAIAVELAARVSSLDLNDADIRGGQAHVYTVGANLYVTRWARVMVDHGWVRGKVHDRHLQVRVQLNR